MEITDENNADELLAVIPAAQRGPRQIVRLENTSVMPPLRFKRRPVTFHELDTVAMAVWMPNETLAVMNTDDDALEVEYTKYFEMEFDFDSKSTISFRIYGESMDRIFETALFFASLKISAETEMKRIVIGYENVAQFEDSHVEQFALLLDTIPTKHITFSSCVHSDLLSVIATRPYLIHLELEEAHMDVELFVEHLQTRTTSQSFGSLALIDSLLEQEDLTSLFDHLNLFQRLEVGRLSNELLFKLLAAPAESIEFVFNAENDEIDLASASIVPKHIKLYLTGVNFPSRFVLSFLYRVTQLGHLESLAIFTHSRSSVPAEVKDALLQAVRSNKNLELLKLVDRYGIMERYMEDIFDRVADHEGLRSLELFEYPVDPDPELTWLMQLLKRNRQVKVNCMFSDTVTLESDIDEIHSLSRFYHGSKSLENKPESIRSSLVGAALTQNAGCVQRIGLLLSDHTDTLCCEVLHGSAPTNETEGDVMEADEES